MSDPAQSRDQLLAQLRSIQARIDALDMDADGSGSDSADISGRSKAGKPQQKWHDMRSTLRLIAKGTSGQSISQCFESLVRHLAETLGFRYVFLVRLDTETKSRAKMLAVWDSGRLGEPLEYDLPGTPCDNVVHQSLCIYSHGVQQLFPDDLMLGRIGAESYLGTPLVSPNGEVLGLLAAIDDQPMVDCSETREIFEVFASHAASELHRWILEEALKQSQMRQELALDAGAIGTWDYDVASDRLRADERMARMFGIDVDEASRGAPLAKYLALIHEEDRDRVTDIIHHALRIGGTHVAEFRIRQGDLERWVQGRGRVELDDFGTAVRAPGALTDITDRKVAEESLRASDARLRIITQQLPAILWTTDRDLRFTLSTGAGLSGLGLEPNQTVGVTLYEYFQTDDPEFPPIAPHLRALDGQSASYEFLHRDRMYRVHVEPLRDQGGDVIGTIGVAQDVTDFKRAEDALKESEERLRLVFDQQFQAMTILSADGRVLAVNDLPLRMQAATREDYIGQLFWKTPAWKDLPQWQDVIQSRIAEVAKRTQPLLTEDEYRAADGTIHYAEAAYTAIRDEQEQLRFILVQWQDITERKRTEAELQETRAILAAAIEASPAGIVIADAPDVRIRSVNSAALGIRGAPLHELTDIPVELHPQRWRCFHPDGTPFEPQDLPLSRAVLEGVVSKNVDVIIQRPNGEQHWVLGNAAPVRNRDGEIVAGVVVFPDVTESKRAESSLREKEAELSHVARISTMGEMAASLAHELNQPLYAIQNYGMACRVLLDDQREVDRGQLVEWLDAITSTAEFAGEVLLRLRKFVDKAPIEKTAGDPVETIDTAISLSQHEAQLRGVTIHRKIPSALPAVSMDKVQIQQVLVNLLRNAFEATQQHSHGTPRVTVAAQVTGGSVEVTVADNGPGLPDNDRKIFKAFHSTKPAGMGLGLAIGTTIIEAHGGSLEACNQSGGGAKFRFTLPIEPG